MNYTAKIYAKAFCEAVLQDAKEENIKKCVKNLLLLVEKNRDQRKLKEVLQIAEKILSKKTNYRKVLIETARPQSPENRKVIKPLLWANDGVEEKIDKDMVAGVRITINDELQFDGSLNTRIKKLLNIN